MFVYFATIHGCETHGIHDVGAWIVIGESSVPALAQKKAGNGMHFLQTPQGETANSSQNEGLTNLRL